MKEKVSPQVAVAVIAVLVVILGFVGYKVFTGKSSENLTQVNVRPSNPDDPKYKPKLPANVGGGGGG